MESGGFYSSSESSSKEVSSWVPPLFAEGSDGGGTAGGKVSFNAGKEMGNTAERSRSDLASLEYFYNSCLCPLYYSSSLCFVQKRSIGFCKDVSLVNNMIICPYDYKS